MPEPWRRHDLIDVAPAAWTTYLAGRPDLDGVAHLADWARCGRPVILRRRHPGEAADHIAAGLPLPPADGKRRIGLALPASAVTRRAPVTLAQAKGGAPDSWRPTLDRLIGLGAAHGLVPRVFGGLLWQAVTGLAYLTPASDLDLLWPLSGPLDPALLRGIAAIEAEAPMRLDGEILLPDGAGLNWREVYEAPKGGGVLAKACGGLDLRIVAAGPDGRLALDGVAP